MRVTLEDFTARKSVYKQRVNISVGIGLKEKETGDWQNQYMLIQGIDDKDVPNELNEFEYASGFLTFYINRDGEPKYKLVVDDYKMKETKTENAPKKYGRKK